jgi:hypothetical protein
VAEIRGVLILEDAVIVAAIIFVAERTGVWIFVVA